MDEPQNREDSWDTLSTVLPNLEISLSQDSCYASDEASVPSAITTVAATANVSSPVAPAKLPLAPVLKSILKKPCAELEAEDTESESGYESDASGSQYDASSDCDFSASQDFDGEDLFDDDDDDDASDVSYEYETSEEMTESHEGDESDFDDSFITFESSVRFNTEVCYIEAPDLDDDDEDDNVTSETTVHEMMELARASGRLRILQEAVDNEASDGSAHDSCSEDDCSSTNGDIMDGPEEHTRDDIELDKQLFIAYMNGINGVPEHKYKPRLRTRANEIRLGRAQSPFFESETVYGAYLDHVLNHVIGIFRNLVERHEFEELVRLTEGKAAMEQLNASPETIEEYTKKLLGRIEELLSERLTKGNVEVGADELSFFAGGVAYALENWSIYTYD